MSATDFQGCIWQASKSLRLDLAGDRREFVARSLETLKMQKRGEGRRFTEFNENESPSAGA